MRRGSNERFLESYFLDLTILVPCFNEEKGIRNSIKYLKQIDYPKLTIIIINDGSVDSTFDILKRELRLTPYPLVYNPLISTQQLKQIYKSNNGTFIVVDKVNGGKADSLNAGLNLCKTDLVCCVDCNPQNYFTPNSRN
jgi:cellulose synthase/poly-beta-1,6-N-acetylglucosamine synthase-like glycosyltransferase